MQQENEGAAREADVAGRRSRGASDRYAHYSFGAFLESVVEDLSRQVRDAGVDQGAFTVERTACEAAFGIQIRGGGEFARTERRRGTRHSASQLERLEAQPQAAGAVHARRAPRLGDDTIKHG